MLLAHLGHWYHAAIFFAPLPIIGLYVWLSGRRYAAQAEREQADSRAAPAAGAESSGASG